MVMGVIALGGLYWVPLFRESTTWPRKRLDSWV